MSNKSFQFTSSGYRSIQGATPLYRFTGSSMGKIDDQGVIQTPQTTISKPHREKENTEPAVYKLNKSKVRNKIHAWEQVLKNRQSFKFITISYPKSFSDLNCKKALNTFLTRCRKIRRNFNYLWVAERQKNGTLHYHILTTDYFNIRLINRYMAKTIDNIIQRSDESWGNSSLEKYNGVDVRNVSNSKSLIGYVTKYITKNDTEIKGCVWNCSSKISQLFTKINLTQEEWNKIERHLIKVYTVKIEVEYQKDPLIIEYFNSRYGNKAPPNKQLIELNKNIFQS